MGLLVRLSRAIPLVGVLVVLAIIIYFVALFRFPNARAKQIVIEFFNALCIVLSVGFLLITLYALLDGNVFAAELFGSFLLVTVVGLIITKIVNWRFLKRYPQYKYRAQEAHVETWQRKLLNLLLGRK